MTIDDCYEKTVKMLELSGEVIDATEILKSLPLNRKVDHVYYLMKSLKTFPMLKPVLKNALLSTQYRNHGNDKFAASENYKAWQYYNLALMNAPIKSEEFVLALANRTVVLLTLNKYQECLNDIDVVLSLNCPQPTKDRVLKRQEMCFTKMRQKNKVVKKNVSLDDICKSDGPRNLVYPCASAKINVHFTDEMGNHVVANEDIDVGEIISKENGYTILLNKSYIHINCTYCLSFSANLMPCENCCFALFCSDECKVKAAREYHDIECPMMADIVALDFTKLEWNALRITTKARADHESWLELFKTIQDAETRRNTIHHGQVEVEGKWIFDSKYYTSTHSMATNIEHRSVSDIFQKCVTAAVFFYMLEEQTNFLESEDFSEKAEIRQCIASLLLTHIMRSATSMHSLTVNTQNSQGKFIEGLPIGSGAFPFTSLLNHSCNPNVVRANNGNGVTILMALRPIKKGSQLFDNYGFLYVETPSRVRQTRLLEQYKFVCECEACTEDWPLYQELTDIISIVPNNIRKTFIKHMGMKNILALENGCLETVTRIFKELCKIAQELENFAPCSELFNCQEAIKQCVDLVMCSVPGDYMKTIDWIQKS